MHSYTKIEDSYIGTFEKFSLYISAKLQIMLTWHDQHLTFYGLPTISDLTCHSKTH